MDFSTGGFPVDLVIFGMIAVFLVLRLRSILGKRTGLERPVRSAPAMAAAPVIEARAEPAPPAERPLPDPQSPLGRKLAMVQARDRSFDAPQFLRGAEAAFRQIVQAFAAGDRDTLRKLLTHEAYTAFEQAISARDSAGETQRAEIRAIHQITIQDAGIIEQPPVRAAIELRYVSDQVSVTLGRNGEPVSGADAVTELCDIWTFERLLDRPSGENGWRLSAARSA